MIGWGWFYLSTVLDDFSHYILGWKLCTNMGADDVSATLDIALATSGCDSVTVLHKPRLLSDNGPCYIAGDLAKYLHKNGMDHVRGAPNHPRRKARSSAGTRLSRTASCSKTTIWRVSLRRP